LRKGSVKPPDGGAVHIVDHDLELMLAYDLDQGAVSWEYPDPEEGRGVTWNYG
jgi:ferredoxin like protein